MKVAAITMKSCADVETNLQKVFSLTKQAATQGAQWVILPETFPFMGGDYATQYQLAEKVGHSKLLDQLACLSKELKITLFAGTIAEKPPEEEDDGKRVYNTLFVFGPDGELVTRYRKIHLFKINNRDSTTTVSEEDGFLAGNNIVSLNHDQFRVGLAICYDLRFSAFFQALSQEKPLDIVVIPAAFTQQTGKDHWHLLLRARAVEFQCYIIAANQCGFHTPCKASYGHSLIIDPWGEILTDGGPNEGIIYADLDASRLHEVRSRIPIRSHQRKELY